MLALLPPAVSVAALPEFVTVPAPASEPKLAVKPPRSRLAPADTVIAELLPRAVAEPAFNVPEVTLVAPLYVFAADKVRVPAPACVSEPLPLTMPLWVSALERLYTSAPVLVMEPDTLPVVPPSPICSVPALMVAPAADPVSTTVPVPFRIKLPVSDPLKVDRSARLTPSEPLTVPPQLPLVPPLPMVTEPETICVVPENELFAVRVRKARISKEPLPLIVLSRVRGFRQTMI